MKLSEEAKESESSSPGEMPALESLSDRQTSWGPVTNLSELTTNLTPTVEQRALGSRFYGTNSPQTSSSSSPGSAQAPAQAISFYPSSTPPSHQSGNHPTQQVPLNPSEDAMRGVWRDRLFDKQTELLARHVEFSQRQQTQLCDTITSLWRQNGNQTSTSSSYTSTAQTSPPTMDKDILLKILESKNDEMRAFIQSAVPLGGQSRAAESLEAEMKSLQQQVNRIITQNVLDMSPHRVPDAEGTLTDGSQEIPEKNKSTRNIQDSGFYVNIKNDLDALSAEINEIAWKPAVNLLKVKNPNIRLYTPEAKPVPQPKQRQQITRNFSSSVRDVEITEDTTYIDDTFAMRALRKLRPTQTPKTLNPKPQPINRELVRTRQVQTEPERIRAKSKPYTVTISSKPSDEKAAEQLKDQSMSFTGTTAAQTIRPTQLRSPNNDEWLEGFMERAKKLRGSVSLASSFEDTSINISTIIPRTSLKDARNQRLQDKEKLPGINRDLFEKALGNARKNIRTSEIHRPKTYTNIEDLHVEIPPTAAVTRNFQTPLRVEAKSRESFEDPEIKTAIKRPKPGSFSSNLSINSPRVEEVKSPEPVPIVLPSTTFASDNALKRSSDSVEDSSYSLMQSRVSELPHENRFVLNSREAVRAEYLRYNAIHDPPRDSHEYLVSSWDSKTEERHMTHELLAGFNTWASPQLPGLSMGRLSHSFGDLLLAPTKHAVLSNSSIYSADSGSKSPGEISDSSGIVTSRSFNSFSQYYNMLS